MMICHLANACHLAHARAFYLQVQTYLSTEKSLFTLLIDESTARYE